MKGFILAFICLTVLTASAEDMAVITLNTTPPGVRVRLDSVLVGTSPLRQYPVQPGNHRLEVLSPFTGLWNIQNIVKEFSIKSGHDTTIHIRFPHPVKINSVPYNASLMHNHSELGRTPLTIPFENNQGKEFRLEKKGYQSRQFTLNSHSPVLLTLQPLDPDIATDKSANFTHKLMHTKLRTKFLFLTGTVATHWLAFYIKNVADDKYNRYSATSNPALMNKYWDETRKFDRYSDITLGVSYVLLSGLLYTLFFN
ncbi:MAG: PEGA domain-containing protein [Calditrichia bacterium]